MAPMTHNQYVHWILEKERAERKASGTVKTTKEDPTIIDQVIKDDKVLQAIQAITPALASQDAGGQGRQAMKALSIKQPYAGLIIAGIKNVENRSWQTKFTGQLVIVSTKSPDAKQWWEPMREKCKKLGVEFPEELCKINAAALGVVDFNYMVWTAGGYFDTITTDHPTIPQAALMDWWDPDMIGFILEHPRRLCTPIHVTGRLGLYNLAEDVAEQIEKQLQ